MMAATYWRNKYIVLLGILLSLIATNRFCNIAVEEKWDTRNKIASTPQQIEKAHADGANRLFTLLFIAPFEAVVYTAFWGFLGWRYWPRLRGQTAVIPKNTAAAAAASTAPPAEANASWSSSENNSGLAQAFFASLPAELIPYKMHDPRVILQIPASAAEVGDLLVYDDGNELTVCVGNIAHSHFEAYCENDPTQREREQNAAARACRWIQAILAEEIRFRCEFSKGRFHAGSSWNPAHHDGGKLLAATDEYREYSWQGEKLHKTRHGGLFPQENLPAEEET